MASRDEFEDGKCPHCRSEDLEEEHNIANIGFLNGVGYFLDFPFGKNYKCNKCGAENEDATETFDVIRRLIKFHS